MRRILKTPKVGRTHLVKKNWLKNPQDVKFYNSSAWRKLSLAYKKRHPACEIEGCTQHAAFTDHKIPISEGGSKLAWTNLQCLCVSHNASKTRKQQNKTQFNK